LSIGASSSNAGTLAARPACPGGLAEDLAGPEDHVLRPEALRDHVHDRGQRRQRQELAAALDLVWERRTGISVETCQFGLSRNTGRFARDVLLLLSFAQS